MKIKRPDRRRSVLSTWFFSYLSVLLVPIFITGGVYSIYQNTIEEEISRANVSLLRQVQAVMDTRISEIRDLAMQIALNPRVKIATNVKGHFSPEDQMNLYKVTQDFNTYKASNRFIDDCFLYLNLTDSAIEAGSHMSGEMLYQFHFDMGVKEYGEWIDEMNKSYQGIIKSVAKKSISGIPYNALIYMQSIPLEDPQKPLGTIVITIDEARLMEIIRNVNWLEKGTVFILDQNNQILMSSKSIELPKSIDYQALENEDFLEHINIDGQEMSVACIVSEVMPWKYVTMIPSKIFWEKAQAMRQLICYGIFGCVVLGGIVAYGFTKLNYHPINKLVKAFSYQKEYPYDKSNNENEYEFIHKSIQSTLQEQDRMRGRINQQSIVLRENFLTHVLRGELQDEFLNKTSFPSYDIWFDEEKFIVVLLYLNNYMDSYELSKFIVTNIFEELINRNYKGYIVEMDEMVVCIINGTDETQEKWVAMIEAIIYQTKEILLNEFQITITIAVSDVHDSLIGVSQAYEEAFSAMEYRMMSGDKYAEDIIYYKQIQQPSRKYLYSMEMEQKLINNIKTGDFKSSKELLDQIFKMHYTAGCFSAEMGRCLIFDLVSTFIKAMDPTKSERILGELKPVERLMKVQNIKKMREELFCILQDICEYVGNEKKKEYLGELEGKVKDFIQKHYSDNNLNVSMLGEEFNITSAYLSKIFKNHVGLSLH